MSFSHPLTKFVSVAKIFNIAKIDKASHNKGMEFGHHASGEPMIFSNSELDYYRKNFFATPTRQPSILKKQDNLIAYLEASEKRLVDFVNGQRVAGPFVHSLSRYILLNLQMEIRKQNVVSSAELQAMETLAYTLELDKTLITPEVWEKLQQQSISLGGTIDGEGRIYRLLPKPYQYEQLDFYWASALVYYEWLNLGITKKADFVIQPQTAGIPVTSDSVKIALVGDWGSGPYKNADGVEPSRLVMESISKQNPDFTIHLGDVYYNGTASSDVILPNEEQNNLVDVWPIPEGQGLALNSNHEMYPGGHGLFEVALTSPRFSLQNGASYFALVHKSWVIFGLDSAYYDNSPLYRDGALTDQAQLNFIKGIDTTGKKIIVLTHHNGLTVDGKTKTSLWNNINAAFGGKDPDFWYWGHIHNAIAYSSKANAGSTKARSIGNGAMPFSKGTSLYQIDGSETGTNNPEISFYAGQELPIQPYKGHIELACNGYAMLTLTADSLTEVFYDLKGNEVWAPPSYEF